VRLAFVGDIALGDHPKTVGFGFRSRYPRGLAADLATRLLPPGPAPDLFFGNLEFALGASSGSAPSLATEQCRGIDEYADFLENAGVSVLNVANNHSAQHGAGAFWSTVARVRDTGMAVVGTPDDFSDATVVEIGNLRVAVLGWSDRPRQYAREVPPYNELDDRAGALIRDARQRADIVVVSVHWGEEFVQLPANRERRIARSMIDAGAAIVVGHHPHVLREVELYADGLIAYSLGNFIGDMTWTEETRLGGCLVVDLDARGLRSHHFALSRIEADYLPRYLPAPEAAAVHARLAKARREQASAIAERGYESVVRAEHQRHVRATALMMARNLHRYRRGTLLPMLTGAIVARLGRRSHA
jgi:hypothetical protein